MGNEEGRPARTAFDVTDRVVFITGAGRGIGRGIAEVLAHAGADVALNALTADHVERAAKEIAEASGRRVIPFVGDMTDPLSVAATVEAVYAEFVNVDVLVNGVGDAIGGQLASIGVDQLERVLDLNLRATLLTSRAIGARFIERRLGKVINISSATAARGGAGLTVYVAGKIAVEALTRALAVEWASFNITVNCVAPGVFPDPRAATPLDPGIVERVVKQVPLGRLGDVHDVGQVVRFLASSASDYMTGQTIFLDGGLTL